MTIDVWKKASKKLQDDVAHSPMGEVLWVKLRQDLFQQKVKLALYGLDKVEGKRFAFLNTYVEKIKKMCEKKAGSLKSLDMGIVYVCVFHGTQNIVVPTFRFRKMMDYSNMYFVIDCFGTVFENWEDFEQNNPWDKCILIYPKNGIYDINKYDRCILRMPDQSGQRATNRTLYPKDAYKFLEKNYWMSLDLSNPGKCWLEKVAGVMAVRSEWPSEEFHEEIVYSSISTLARIKLGYEMGKMCCDDITKNDIAFMKNALLLLCQIHVDSHVAKEIILQARQGLSPKGGVPKREQGIEREILTISSYKRYYDEKFVSLDRPKKIVKHKILSQLGEFHR